MSGLIVGNSLTLSNSNGDSLSVSADGNFTFPVKLASGGSFAVTVTTPPVAQNCTVAAGSGSNIAANVTNVAVTCTAAQQYAYVLNNGLNSISYFKIDNNGLLTNPGNVAAIATGASPETITVDPSRHYVYVTNLTDQNVSQYLIQSDGTLRPNTPATVPVGCGPNGFAIDPAGKYAYVVCVTDQSVSQFTIDANGGLTKTSAAAVSTGVHPWDISVTPNDKFVYVTDLGNPNAGGVTIEQYSVAADGSLSALSPTSVATGSFPTGHAVDAQSSHVYVANAGDNRITQYSIGATGQLSPLSPASVASGGDEPDFVAIHPSGKFLYVPNYLFSVSGPNPPGSVSLYSIASDGSLSAQPVASYPTGVGPVWLTLDALGRYAYVVNLESNSITEFSVGSGGQLTQQTGVPLSPSGNAQPYAMVTSY